MLRPEAGTPTRTRIRVAATNDVSRRVDIEWQSVPPLPATIEYEYRFAEYEHDSIGALDERCAVNRCARRCAVKWGRSSLRGQMGALEVARSNPQWYDGYWLSLIATFGSLSAAKESQNHVMQRCTRQRGWRWSPFPSFPLITIVIRLGLLLHSNLQLGCRNLE